MLNFMIEQQHFYLPMHYLQLGMLLFKDLMSSNMTH